MKILEIAVTGLCASSVASALSLPFARYGRFAISRREAEAEPGVLTGPINDILDEGLLSYLEKRRGGGGSGGGGGRSSSSSGSSSSGSSSSGSSGSSSSSGKSGSSGSSSGSRNTGTASSSSSISPSYGGGRYFAGGSGTAYRAGSRSPSGIVPFALLGAGLAIFPGLWLYGAYEYNYDHPYSFHNASNASQPTNQNETLPVTCLCQQYSACGCDNNDNSTYLGQLLGNGSPSSENSSLIHVGDVNGTKTIIINGTLPNGTDTSGAMRNGMVQNSVYWVTGILVGAMMVVL